MKIGRPPAACCVVVALAMSSCSAMLSRPPPPTPLATLYDCDDSRSPIWLDGFWIANSGGLALAAFGGAALRYSQAKDDTAPSWDPRPDTSALSTLLVIGAIATGVTVALVQSARYGARSADACTAARMELLSRPPFYPVPPAAVP